MSNRTRLQFEHLWTMHTKYVVKHYSYYDDNIWFFLLISTPRFIHFIETIKKLFSENTTQLRTDFPRPDMVVTCLSDGVQVEIHITEKGFNGVLYVKGHSKNEQCRRVVSMAQDSSPRTEIFKVNFGNCGLIHINVSLITIGVHLYFFSRGRVVIFKYYT